MLFTLHGDPAFPGQAVLIIKAAGFVPGETMRIALTSPQGEQTNGQAVADKDGVVSGKIPLGPTAEVLGDWRLELAGKKQTRRATVTVKRP